MENNPSVCILKKSFSGKGGLEKYTWRIAQAFANRDCPVTILTSDVSKHPHPLIHFKRLPLSSSIGYRQVAEFDQKCSEWMSNKQFDIVLGMDRNREQTHLRAGNGVHAAFLKQRDLSESFLKKLSRPINPLHRLILDIEKTAFESPRLKTLFTNSEMVRTEVLEYYDVPEERIEVVHNGVEWKEFQTPFDQWIKAKTDVAKALRLDPTSYQFLFAGNGYKRKGLEPLLKGLSLLPFKDWHLSVVGKEKNIGQFTGLAGKLGIADKVTFYGPKPDLTPFFQLADSLVIPSFYDPFANVTLEALAMGLFVISSKSNGGHEILKSDIGTLIGSLEAPESLMEALMRAIDHPKTWFRSQNIRNEVQYLDFPNQLKRIVNRCLD